MSKFEPGDIAVVYTDTPTFIDGGVVQILDYDPNDGGSYSVAELRDIASRDMTKITELTIVLQRFSKWVKPENMRKVQFKKPGWFRRWLYGE